MECMEQYRVYEVYHTHDRCTSLLYYRLSQKRKECSRHWSDAVTLSPSWVSFVWFLLLFSAFSCHEQISERNKELFGKYFELNSLTLWKKIVLLLALWVRIGAQIWQIKLINMIKQFRYHMPYPMEENL